MYISEQKGSTFNEHFGRKTNKDVGGNRKQFWNEVSNGNGGSLKSYWRIKDGNGKLALAEDEV